MGVETKDMYCCSDHKMSPFVAYMIVIGYSTLFKIYV